MLAGVYHMTCEQGSTFVRNLEIERPDPGDPTGTTFVPYTLAAHTARMQIRRTLENATPMVSLTSTPDAGGNGIVMQPLGVENAMRIYMTAQLTATITDSGVYDLEIVNSVGEVARVIQGQFNLSPEVTR